MAYVFDPINNTLIDDEDNSNSAGEAEGDHYLTLIPDPPAGGNDDGGNGAFRGRAQTNTLGDLLFLLESDAPSGAPSSVAEEAASVEQSGGSPMAAAADAPPEQFRSRAQTNTLGDLLFMLDDGADGGDADSVLKKYVEADAGESET